MRPGNDLTFAEWLEQWRGASGQLDLTSASLVKGPLKLDGQGQFSLDESHRVQGQLDLDTQGMEPLLAHFGLPVAALNVGGLLSALSGSPKSKPTTPAGAVHLNMRLDKGAMLMGPLKLPVRLVPLY